MKKVLALAIVVTMLVSVFAIGASAVDNYEPKTINLIANSDGTVSLPEGYVVYVGDTLVFPRGEMVFIGDFTVRNSNPPVVREMAVAVANDIMIDQDGVRVGQIWVDNFSFSNASKGGDNWFESGVDLESPGTYTFYVYSARDGAWTEQYLVDPELKVLEVELIDPKTVDTIVTPPAGGNDAPADEPVASEDPVESTEEPVESTEEPVESTEEPVESTEEPVESTEEPTESKGDEPADEPADAPADEPADNGALLWIIIGAVAVVAVVVVIVLVSKKKK